MISFISRRLLIAFGVLIAASYLFYVLAASSGDPLADLRESTQKNKDELIQLRTERLRLDVPVALRYFLWAGGALRGDLGRDYITDQKVTGMLQTAMGSTFKLVILAAIFALVLGVSVGILSALRQYTPLDYMVTLVSFFLYSLPSFWVAVVLKDFMAIRFNNFLENPQVSVIAIISVGVVGATITLISLGGRWRKKILIALTVGLFVAALLASMGKFGWFDDPSLGLVGVAILGTLLSLGITALVAGFDNRRVLYTGLTVVLIGVVALLPLQEAFKRATAPLVIGVCLALIAIGALVGWFLKGVDKRLAIRQGAITGAAMFFLIYIDTAMGWWQRYAQSGAIGGRPIATVGSSDPDLAGSGYFPAVVDTYTHLWLPVTAIMLVSFAGYTRYARGSLLEVMNNDYIRTARAKGLPERTVIARHAFRNALIPLATLIPLDIAGLVGGAVITETVFGWKGMGRLFIEGLTTVNMNPLMGFFLVTSGLLLLATLFSDLLYAALDPRIKVSA